MNDRLLPYEAITAKLIDDLAVQQEKEDAEFATRVSPPTYWKLAVKAAKESQYFRDIVGQTVEQLEGSGNIGGTTLKLLLMGWRMAEIHLSQQQSNNQN